MINLLIPYKIFYDHPDPLFDEYTYGDTRARARKLKTHINKGNYVFFHIGYNGKRYITAYYVVDRVLDTINAINDRNIRAKYKNPHIVDLINNRYSVPENDVVLFGDPITSKILEKHLLFNKELADKLSLGIHFPDNRSENQSISSSTRAWRELSDKDVQVLLNEIEKNEESTAGFEAILSSDEVAEIIERDIEGFIAKNSSIIGSDLTLKNRQLAIQAGRIDLLFEDTNSDLIVVELKLNKIGRGAVNQVRRYVKYLQKESGKQVKGYIVCKGVMPAFEEEFSKLTDIKIMCYGWQLKVYDWKI